MKNDAKFLMEHIDYLLLGIRQGIQLKDIDSITSHLTDLTYFLEEEELLAK